LSKGRYYVRRRAKGQDKSEKPRQNTRYKRFAKLGVVIDCDSHLILAAEAGRGPRPDVDRFVPLLEQAVRPKMANRSRGTGDDGWLANLPTGSAASSPATVNAGK
jgi:hypothetical protein